MYRSLALMCCLHMHWSRCHVHDWSLPRSCALEHAHRWPCFSVDTDHHHDYQIQCRVYLHAVPCYAGMSALSALIPGTVLPGAEVRLEDGRSLKARVVLGADGARSKVAPVMQLPTPNYAGYSAYRFCRTPASCGLTVSRCREAWHAASNANTNCALPGHATTLRTHW